MFYPMGREPSSLKAKRRLIEDRENDVETARGLLLASLISISAVPVKAFSKDEQKEATILKRDIAEKVRRLRKMVGQ